MHFRSIERENTYLAACKEAMKAWPVPWEEIEVSNRFGTTYVLARPESVRKLIQISPAASLLPLVKQFIPRIILSSLPPEKFWFYSLMAWMGLKRGTGHEFSQRLLDLMWHGGKSIEMSAKAGIEIHMDALEEHSMAGGNVEHVITKLISAKNKEKHLSFKEACTLDLARKEVTKKLKYSKNNKL